MLLLLQLGAWFTFASVACCLSPKAAALRPAHRRATRQHKADELRLLAMQRLNSARMAHPLQPRLPARETAQAMEIVKDRMRYAGCQGSDIIMCVCPQGLHMASGVSQFTHSSSYVAGLDVFSVSMSRCAEGNVAVARSA